MKGHTWNSFVWYEGQYLPYFHTNLVVVFHELLLHCFGFSQSPQRTTCANMILHLPLAYQIFRFRHLAWSRRLQRGRASHLHRSLQQPSLSSPRGPSGTAQRVTNLPLLTKEHDTFQTVKIFYFKTDSQTIFICWDTYITYTFGDGLTQVWGGNKCVVMLMKLQIKVGIIAKGGTT